jgi:hypothetical protein
MRDALELAEAIDKVVDGKVATAAEVIGSYQSNMMRRGVEAVRKSRGQVREDRKPDEPWTMWGYPARPTPEETVKLSDWL